jgi:hypothetical protein
MQPGDLLELRNDLRRERRRLERLVDSLAELRPRLPASAETVEVHRLRLRVVAELQRKSREGFQRQEGLGVTSPIRNPRKECGEVVDEG